ncbi:MAG TPA: hypothetical protein PKD85_05295 [Saprospiraceae bacterium]|nr:hypothetical protein [Saprospiraceae bacterium]
MKVKVFFEYQDKEYHFLTFYPLFVKNFKYKTDIGQVKNGKLILGHQFLEELTVMAIFGKEIIEEFPDVQLDENLNVAHFDVEVYPLIPK